MKFCIALIMVCIVLGMATAIYLYWDEARSYATVKGECASVWGFWHGKGGNPWQYRVLGYWLDRAWFACSSAEPISSWKPKGSEIEDVIPWNIYASFQLKIGENILVFFSLYAFTMALGLGRHLSLGGLPLFALILAIAQRKAGIMHSSYLEIPIYLWGGIAVMKGGEWWILPLTALGALNRETSILIPFLAIGLKKFWPGGLAFFLWGLITLGLRHAFPPQLSNVIDRPDLWPGLLVLVGNLTKPEAWATVGIMFLPFLAITVYGWKGLSTGLHRFFWWVALPFTAMIYIGGNVFEARLLLVPIALCFYPATLMTLRASCPK